MVAVIDDSSGSWSLSPEQRALVAQWGGDQHVRDAVRLLQIEFDSDLSPEQLRKVVASAIGRHSIFQSAIRQVAGYRGLRLQATDGTASLGWTVWDRGIGWSATNHPVLEMEQGELVRAALARDASGRQTLTLAVSALVADRGSLATLGDCIARQCRDDEGVDPAFQYSQYIEWRQELESDADASSREYWHAYLQGADEWAAPALVYRRTDSSAAPATRVVATQLAANALLSRVTKAAAAIGAKPEVLLQAVWWALLARLTGLSRFSGGWQHDCRLDYDVMQGAIGVFDKILPLQIECNVEELFSAYLARMVVRTDAHAEAQEHCPLEALATRAHLSVGFAYREVPALQADARWHIVEPSMANPAFELLLRIEASSDEAQFVVEADASLYSQQAIERLLAQFVTQLAGVLERPDCPVRELPWIAESEKRLLQANWKGPVVDYSNRTLTERFVHWAGTTPEAPALASASNRVSYRALDEHANRLAHWMRSRGVEPGALVALAMPRSMQLIVAALATWRIGAGYLPLDPEWPDARRQLVLTDAAPALVLSELPALDAFPSMQPRYEPCPEDVAYVLYTSGSTGRPKGVVIEQRQLFNYVAASSSAMSLADARCWGLVSSVAADLGNTALFGALFNGACLAVASADESKNGAAFARFLARHEIDALKIVPSHLEALMEGESLRLPRMLVLGGEVASRALLDRVHRSAPDCAIYNHYGPTETTVGVMVHLFSRDESQAEVLPLSLVLANNHIRVLDPTLRPVPAGAKGEVCVGGNQLCRGYLNRDGGDSFVDDSWRPGERLYRTGDLAWVLPEGGLRLAGRADHQVKIRGYRVEPAEVEAALLNVQGVRQAVVLAHAVGGLTELIAFVVVSADERDALQNEWRDRLAGSIPTYMVPTNLVFVTALPRLPNGKVDRLALIAQARATSAFDSDAPPASPLETVLAQLMALVLGREQIAASEDFFRLGGHSLLVIRLVARIRKILQIEVEPGLLFDHSTAQSLATQLLARHDSAELDQLARAHLARG